MGFDVENDVENIDKQKILDDAFIDLFAPEFK
jgi:hypothetical protein